MTVELRLTLLFLLLFFTTGYSLFMFAFIVALGWLFVSAIYGLLTGE